ncbi:MAG: MgtC/SapB family protein [Dissulfurispiraceae bacterium]
MTLYQFIINNFVALLSGAVIGIERQWRQRTAGLRTNSLVALGASLFVSLSSLVTQTNDHTRMAAQVITGIGFLGAGLMLKEGMNVRGLNTAATLWSAGAIGTLAGSGFLPHAVIGAGLVIATHLVFRPIAKAINRQPVQDISDERLYILRIVCRSNDEQNIRTLFVHEIVKESLLLQAIESEDLQGTDKVEVKAFILANGRQDTLMEKVVGLLSLEQAVSAASWKHTPQQLDE